MIINKTDYSLYGCSVIVLCMGITDMIQTCKQLIITFLLIIVGLYGCDTSQQTATDTTSRVEFGPNENEKQFGDFIIHVNALTTDQLPADVARTYKITRSKSRAMLNVVITKKTDGEQKPVTGTVKTVTRNLANQIKNMSMRELVEQDAIYYIGDTPVDNDETLIFDIDVTPIGETGQFALTYRKNFFTE